MMKKLFAILLAITLVSTPLLTAAPAYAACGAGNPVGATCVVVLTSGPGIGNQTFTVPADWNNSANQVACIGSGGSGGVGTWGSGSGGGGAYASTTNVSLSGTTQYAIGASATTTGVDSPTAEARVTYFGSSASSTASVTCDWGKRASTVGNQVASGAGGLVAFSIGTLRYAGGSGGASFNSSGLAATGGGGSAGENGIGEGGGNDSSNTANGGGGGGGSDGGSSTAGVAPTTSTGGAGGNGTLGTTVGGGGKGGDATSGTGVTGNIDATFDATHGAGGGGGGGAASGSTGGPGGTYGGGGGGGSSVGGTGGQGIIVIIYTPIAAATATPSVLNWILQWWFNI